MNILVIGNGFDLAHGLPTKYMDFLFFCYAVKRLIKDNKIGEKIPEEDEACFNWLNSDEKLVFSDIPEKSSYLFGFYSYEHSPSDRERKVCNEILDDFIANLFLSEDTDFKLRKEIVLFVFENFWIEYFLQCDMHGDENWIDFESEIANVIKAIETKMHGSDKTYSLYDEIADWPDKLNTSFRLYFEKKYGKQVTYKLVRDKLSRDLDKLIRLFEIYLTEYVNKINVEIFSPDIKEIVKCSCVKDGIKTHLYSKVLSFNYTDTYEREYWEEGEYVRTCGEYMDHIHGEAGNSDARGYNNMVLGIDESLGRKKRNKYVEFIAFKKFYQRIHKQTDSRYKKWVDLIREDLQRERTWIYENKDYFKDKYYNLFFFGHSLDITDRDILRDLILNDNVHTTIFYHNKEVMGQQIANLVKVIGEDQLIRRTGGSTKTIEFKQQQPMEPK